MKWLSSHLCAVPVKYLCICLASLVKARGPRSEVQGRGLGDVIPVGRDFSWREVPVEVEIMLQSLIIWQALLFIGRTVHRLSSNPPVASGYFGFTLQNPQNSPVVNVTQTLKWFHPWCLHDQCNGNVTSNIRYLGSLSQSNPGWFPAAWPSSSRSCSCWSTWATPSRTTSPWRSRSQP